MADLLFGKVSPSGKLPVTFYRNLEGMPAFTDYSMKNRTYRYMESEALYPFGYGLTYGNVQVKDAKVLNQVTTDSDIELEVTVENTGRDTEEVVQVYIKDMDSPLAVRNYSLCGFQRVEGLHKRYGLSVSRTKLQLVWISAGRNKRRRKPKSNLYDFQ